MRVLFAKIVFALISVCLPLNAAQTTPAGRISYGGYKTISCLQGGQVVIQHQFARGVELEWYGELSELSFRPPQGKRQYLKFNSASMTCLVEEPGRESVPIVKKR